MIKKVSNEELVEKFMLHVPQSVVGTSFPPSVIKATQNEIETLRTQLAKANERVKELEQINLELAANVEACCELVDMDMGSAIERLFEIDNTESKSLLNKFAIDKKAEALSAVKNEIKTVGGLELCDVVEFIDEQLEQLRKEQE